ncbi:MFS transporter [Cardinium endosymbiont of Culicoides punctatus]|uniref:MFS transporter n=1 Tax=Cardinium endosymbiont of Culicoides punctatus TaxID=2304601 RepID=UPI001058ECD9|nr:MFS transporter [Cardinium endosymbiont of Culicoides punctatus]
MILNGLSSMVPNMLIVGFSITLFDTDKTGISAAYLEPASLLGIGCAGVLGGFLFRRFTAYTIGICTVLISGFTLFCLLWYSTVNVRVCTITLFTLACIMSIEHSNGLAFISKQIGASEKPFFFSTFQLFLQFFNVIAPFGAKVIIGKLGFKYLLVFCIFIYMLRTIPWQLFLAVNPATKASNIHPLGILTGFKEIASSPGLLRMTSFRMINHIATVSYIISLPILVAKIADGNSQVNADLHSCSLSIINLGFILSGIVGSWMLNKKPGFVILFLYISPIFVVSAAVMAFYSIQPLYLQCTALIYGMGLYFFRTANSIIGQALTKKEKLAHVILAGDAVVKSIAYGIGALVPSCIMLQPIWDIAPPFVGCVLCSLFSLRMTGPIVKLYLRSLSNKNSSTT